MFKFFSQLINLQSSSQEKFVLIPKKLEAKAQLLEMYSLELKFPSYFGFNWDALYDCLSDLSWMTEKTIAIVHQDIPLNNLPIEKKKYIKLLFDLLQNQMSKNSFPKLTVSFPSKLQKEIEMLLL